MSMWNHLTNPDPWSVILRSLKTKQNWETCLTYFWSRQYNMCNTKIISIYIFWSSEPDSVTHHEPKDEARFERLMGDAGGGGGEVKKKIEKTTKKQREVGAVRIPKHRLRAVEAWPEPRRGRGD